MPVVFVHGVPETTALWDDLRAALGRRDSVALALPGFGCPRPAGFAATKEAYVDWLIAEIAALGEPVHLVGHDWGGGLALRAACLRPDLLRSWVSDAAGLADLQFEWHEFAKIWQTPDAGEQFFRDQLALPLEQRAVTFEGFGVPPVRAREMAAWIDETMAACILALYRSAVDIGKEWAPAIHDITKPGLVVIPENDPFLVADCARRTAQRSGARVANLDGLGHWWALQAPERGAEMLSRFWDSLR
jgi:pimeloyl-ACP methyl ester carboxylesterase